jgi:eukaryotic-like serine/threonine-protein kinase
LESINGFQVLRKVAESNTAEIFHVRRTVGKGKGSDVAVKVLRPEFASDAGERNFLENEYRICSTLDHPHVIHVHEIQMAAPRPFMVMDLVSGNSLRQVIDKGLPRLADALEWIAQAAEGLGHCHEQGYVHRDVKPQNILVDDNGQVTVIDFALAVAQEHSLGKYLWRRMTDRRRPGTWSYMAPEQIRRQRQTAMADVYGLGVALFETVTGRLPFSDSTSQGLLEQHLFTRVPSVCTLREGVPLSVDEIIRSMMAKDPLDRPAGMRYVSGKLRALIPSVRNVG